MTTPAAGLYGSEITYACTNQAGSYCYSPSYGGPVASTATAVQPYLDRAARNWGCDWNFSYSGPYQHATGAWVKWYGTQADNNYGCGVVWWNPKMQAAYFLPNTYRSGNVALASRGATVSVSSTHSAGTPASALIDGNRRGNPWDYGGGWSSKYRAGYPTASAPEWIQISFNSPKTLSEIAVSTLQDNYSSPVEPYINQTFSKYGIRNFSIQWWNGTAWVTIQSYYSNNQVYQRVVFNPIKTEKIRIYITAALDGAARVTEVEAYETNLVSKKIYETYQTRNWDGGILGMPISNPIPYDWTYGTSQLFENGRINLRNGPPEIVLDGQLGTDSNVADVHSGGVASSSGAYPFLYESSINDGRRGTPLDAITGQYPYWAGNTSGYANNCSYGNWWVRVDFVAAREISEIVLFSLLDDYWTGTEPTPSTATSYYGNVDFQLQYCPEGTACAANGSGWLEPAGGHIMGNVKAQSSVTFAPVRATAVRAVLNCVQSSTAYVAELEAWQRGRTPDTDGSITSWSTTSLFAARYDHTATLLASGKVLVAGGAGSSSSSVTSAELYDPSTGIWSSAGTLTSPRRRHTATLLPSGKVLVTGGYASSGGASQATAELYDPDTNTWSSTNSLTTARSNHTATLLPSGKVLVVGGNNQSQYLSSAELYDPTTGTWSSAGSLNGARYEHTAALLPSGKVLVAAGFGPHADSMWTQLPTAELYDPATNSWSSTGALSRGRRATTATLLPSGKVLVTGGETSDASPLHATSSAELYDPTTGTWSAAGSLIRGRFYHTATLLPSGKVLVTGGRGQYAPTENIITLPTTELYDPATNTWSSTLSLPTPRNSHTATALASGAVLVVGGIANGYTVGTAAVFGSPPSIAGVEADIEVGYANPQLHTVTKSPAVFSRGTDQVIVWNRKFDGVDMLTDARSVQLPDGNWTTRFLKELSGPEPVRHAEVWTFANAAQAVGLDPNTVRARLVFRPELGQSTNVPNPTNADDVEMVVNGYRLTIELADDNAMTITYVDAYTGAFIKEVSRKRDVQVPTMKYNVVSIDAASGVYQDPVRVSYRNVANQPVNGQGLVSSAPTAVSPLFPVPSVLTYLPLVPYPDYKNDIAFGLQQSWDYFFAKFQRRGLRNLQPSTTAIANDAVVYFKEATAPSVGMTPNTGAISVEMDPGLIWTRMLTADVIGHEWTHAVWANETGHDHDDYYWGGNGGLNEANSDLFGELIEARARWAAGLQADPDAITDGWVMLQDHVRVRRMCTPSQSTDPAYRDVWSPGIETSIPDEVDAHYAAGPLDRVFCLLGRGMQQNGVGNAPELQSPIVPDGFPALGAPTVARLQYQALVFLRGYPTPASYKNQRDAMLSAATTLYGAYSPEYKAVQDAFAVIKVGPPADRVKPIITLNTAVVSPSQFIQVGVAAANPVRSVTFKLAGTAIGMATSPPWQVKAPNKPPGQYALQVTAIDTHLNETTANFAVTLQDTTDPELCDIQVGPSGGPAGELNVILSGRDDVSGLSGLEIYQNGVAWPVKLDYTATAPGVGRSLVFTKTFAPGTYSFQGWCADKANHTAKTLWRSYTVGSPVPPCNTKVVAGGNTPDTKTFEMGKTSGTVKLTFQTFVVQDRIKVIYQNNVIADTQCVATGQPAPAWAQQFNFSGSSSQITVTVEPNCAGATGGTTTEWNYQLSCP